MTSDDESVETESGDDALGRGRSAFRRQAWSVAFTLLSAADRVVVLGAEDLEKLAVAAYLSGRDDESVTAWTRAHRQLVAAGDRCRASRCAFWLGFALLLRGEMAPASGWMGRSQRVLDDGDVNDCPERGLLLIPLALGLLADDPPAAQEIFTQALAIGRRFDDPDVSAFARLGRGQSLVVQQNQRAGMAELDEAMIAVTSGDVSPIASGLIYCAVIQTCHESFDLRRVQEWTGAMTRWCDAQPELVAYRGQCLVHRSQVLQLHGDWSDAMREAQQACGQLAGPPPHPALGMAYYQQAELHRLCGRFAEAEAAFQNASLHGHQPQPGLARLRLMGGDSAAARAGIRRAVDEAVDDITRSNLVACLVEIDLATGDVTSARNAVDALMRAAATIGAPALSAVAATASGAVLLAEDRPSEALSTLRPAWATWRDLDAPYEAARVRVLIAAACRQLGDRDGAELELEAARRAFERLRAAPDLAALPKPDRQHEANGADAEPARAGRLTSREAEILGLVAKGMSNRAIASELAISDKTVARHVSNIFAKLGVSSRTGAVYAFEHSSPRNVAGGRSRSTEKHP